ncbi:MAG TPA: hypothetical protein ENJ18_09790 [Nannocystis exedens]|nr:hypothetical protein [Nannocystis exedens]
MLLRPALLVPAAALLLVACPQRVEPQAVKKDPHDLSAEDPRVVADTDDLYPARTPPPERPDGSEAPKAPAPTGPAPGAGIPDETNGICRLYAPRLPKPECCAQDLGFDVEVVKKACGYTLYLGESHQMTCGYFFATEETTHLPKWLRLSLTLETELDAAVKAHDRRISLRVAMDPDFHSVAVPGVEGAFWSTHKGLHWAILPGWSKPRLLTWRDDSCSDEGIKEVMRALIKTPEVDVNAERTSLVPGAIPPVGKGKTGETPTPQQ